MRGWGCLAVLVVALWGATGVGHVDAGDARAPRTIPTPGAPSFRVYTDRDGVPYGAQNCAAIDSKGHMWIGTSEGVAIFDGSAWRPVELPASAGLPDVVDILHASDGSTWIATRIQLYRKTEGAWSVYQLEDLGFVPQPGGDAPIEQREMALHGRNFDLEEVETAAHTREIWIASQSGIARFDGASWSAFTAENSGFPPGACRRIVSDATQGGSVWAITSNGLGRYEAGAWTVTALPGAEASIGRPVSLAVTAEGGSGAPSVWVGTERGGLLQFRDGQWTRFDPTNSPLPGPYVETLWAGAGADGEPAIWIGVRESGIARFDPDTNAWDVYTTRNSDLPTASIQFFAATPGGRRRLWMGTGGAGLVCMTGGGWRAMTVKNAGLPNGAVNAILETVAPDGDSVYWIGTDEGLTRYEKGRSTTLAEADGLPSRTVWSLLEVGADRDLWVGTSGGLARLRAGRWEQFTETNSGLTHNLVTSMIETTALGGGAKRLVFGTNLAGLCAYDGGRVVPLDAVNARLPSGHVWAMVETTLADGRTALWLALFDGGLARVVDDEVRVWTSANSPLPTSGATHVSAADGGRRLWIGTDGGAFRADVSGDELRWTKADDLTASALPHRRVNAVVEDARGRVFLCTTGGVVRLTPRETGDGGGGYDAYVCTDEDGLPSANCGGEAALVDRFGRVWAGTTAGAAYYDAASESEPAPTPISIDGGSVDGRAAPLAAGETLAYDENGVEIDFTLASFFKPAETRYRSQLVGFEAEPSAWDTERSRNYTNLPAGTYTFRVWGRDAVGTVTGPATIAFSVRPAPWRTWWAYLAYAALLAGLVYGGTQWRLEAVRRRNAELERLITARTAQLGEAVARLRDSEQQAVDAKDEAVEANRAKSVFLANMSHELRTPLNAVIGFSQLVERRGAVDREDRESLQIIARSGEHLLGLINDVLSISKIEAGKLALVEKPFDPTTLLRAVEGIVGVRAKAKGLEIAFEVDGALLPAVMGDEGKLRQVLINLLGNAVKFTERGRVTLRAGWAEGRARFEVEDTGPGIAPGELATLFEAFSQTESGRAAKEGTGLGLVISRQIVRLMGGDISVSSAPGVGTTFAFEVTLPATEGAAARERRIAVGLAEGQVPPRVLVVDDTAENRLLLTRLLRDVGFEVREAANGAEAVDAWQAWRPDLIFMDMRMPVMDGREATRAIRAHEAAPEGEASSGARRAAPCVIVALTASAFEHERESILSGGADDFLTKPFRVDAILDKIRERLGVRYRYDEPATAVTERPGEVGTAGGDLPTPVALAAVAEPLRQALYAALFAGDSEAAAEIAARVGASDAALGEAIVAAVRAYRYDELLAALEAAGAGR